MNVLHIGLGSRGKQWLAITRGQAGVASAGCVDVDPRALEWVREHVPDLRNACHIGLEEALRSSTADAAIIASPSALHARHAVVALEAGLAVMIETPFAASLAEAARVLEVSRAQGRPVVVAQNYRYARRERTLRALMREKKVGSVTYVSCVERYANPAASADERTRTSSYSQLFHMGIHRFDSLRSILGVRPVAVVARCGRAPWSEYEHGSTTEAVLEMEENIHVQYHGSLTSNRDEESILIEGEDGVLRTSGRHTWWRKRAGRFYVPVPPRTIPPGDSHKDSRAGMATLLDQLKAAVGERGAAETSGDDNVWTLSMLEAAMQSDRTGRVVYVRDLLTKAGLVGLTSPESVSR
jgi:predicted dehydrogenase